ncbi:MAG TPA: IclR family transcriptional regulator C-terminal domain-containing protein [Candidatus Binataceae bacterium]|nr:IclR family transcriptional regulator C-terminal domain-containing protein [Candidatus Binataceae bacterium]
MYDVNSIMVDTKPLSRDDSSALLIQSLARGLAVIRTFDHDHQRLTISQVAQRAQLSRATARRFLLTLTDLGYASFDGKLFALTPRVLDLGYAYLSSTPFWEVAQPHMEAVVAQLHESCSISVLQDNDIVYVARVPTKRIMTVTLGIGSHLPAGATSMGRVLLAYASEAQRERYFATAELTRFTPRTITDPARLRELLREVVQREWALVDQELEEGVRSVAVPVRDAAGRVIAAMNLSGHASRVTVAQMKREFVPALLQASARITATLMLRSPGAGRPSGLPHLERPRSEPPLPRRLSL